MREREREAIFPERLGLKVPAGVNAAPDTLARERHQTKSDLVRQILLDLIAARR